MTTSQAGPAAGPHAGQDVLQRADGVTLIGEMAGSGYRVPPSLVRRGDGQTIQLTTLLYLTLEAVDGHRSVDEVAAAVSERFGRTVSPDNVRSLVSDQLRPLGLLTKADGSQPEVKRSNPLLGLRFRYAVTDPERTRRLTDPFAVLFRPWLLLPLLAAFGFVCWWVFLDKGLASATYQAFDHPGLLLLVFAVTVLSAGFHEFGHAAAARYGGSTPGVMGAGVYLVWPAFYTDVTDSYRLGRGGRVRTDLGGLYFNAIVAVGITGVWWLTRYDALLLVVATQILQMVRQLTPLVRFDGYHVLADVTGVPDLFHRIKPTLLGVLPWRWGDPEARLLKPWARAVVTLWVLLVVPLLLFTMAMLVLAMPRVLATAWAQLEQRQDRLAAAWAGGDLVQVPAQLLTMAAIALPILGTFLILGRVLRRGTRSVWRGTAGHPVRRTVAGLTAAAVVAALVWVWWPDGSTYRPIRPTERGTLTDWVDAVPVAAGLSRPAPDTALAAGDRGVTTALWDESEPLPTEAQPRLAVVKVPRGADAATTDARQGWVFPFDKPLAPEPGDNQAMAVNTEDGTVVYDTAFALVWVEDGADALNANEAYAFASCTGCAAVSVAFQVVLVVGDNDTAVPQNLSAAVNYDCVNCLTYALAQQLFVTLDGPLSPEAMDRLDAMWAQVGAYAEQIQAVPLDEIDDRLDEFEQQILAIIEADQPGTLPSAPPSASASGTAGPSAGAGTSAGPSPSAGSSATSGSGTAPSGSTAPEPDATAGTAEPDPTPTAEPSPTRAPSATTDPSPTASPSG